MSRPILWVGTLFLAGAYAAALGVLPGMGAPSMLVVGGVLLCGLGYHRARAVTLGLVLLIFGGGGLLWAARHATARGDELSRFLASRGGEVSAISLAGRVTQTDVLLAEQDYMRFRVRVDRAVVDGDTIPMQGHTLVRWTRPGFGPQVGDEVRFTGTATVFLSRVNFGVRNVEDYYHRHGVHSTIRVRGPDAVARLSAGPWWSPRRWASAFRAAQAERLAGVVPASSLPFVLTVWLGERRLVDDDLYGAFIESGTAHILAVSGVHTGIVYVTVMGLMRLVAGRRRPRLQIVAVMAMVFLFALAAGARISSLRAASMIFLYLLAEFTDREPDAPTALSIAAMLFTLHNPDVLFDTGFQLSFLSIASILLFSDRIRASFRSVPQVVDSAVRPALAVQVLPLPVAIASFHVLPMLAPLANLVVIPLLGVVLWLCLATSFLAFVAPPVALLSAHAIGPLVYCITAVARFTADLGLGHAYLTSPTAIAIGAYWFALGAALIALRTRRMFFAASAAMSLAATFIFWSPSHTEPEISFIDVGKGDATFIRTSRDARLLVDGGEINPYVDMGRHVVAPFLWGNHVTRLDAVVATHPDRDHLGGLLYVLDTFDVGAVYLGAYESEAPLERKLVARCGELGVPVRRIARGDRIELAGATIEVLHPPRDWGALISDNNRSLVLRVSMNGVTTLLTGDVEAGAEAILAERACTADILKAPHHGSRTSNSQTLIDAVDPAYCVFSTGKHAGRTILKPETVQRYRDAGARVLRTDRQGGVRFRFVNGEPVVETARGTR